MSLAGLRLELLYEREGESVWRDCRCLVLTVVANVIDFVVLYGIIAALSNPPFARPLQTPQSTFLVTLYHGLTHDLDKHTNNLV
jgi:hypothetical protein